MDDKPQSNFVLNRNDVDRKYCRSGGKGGQKVNKVETCVILTHLPTGLQVRSEEHRTREKNEVAAWERLEGKLKDIHDAKNGQAVKDHRNSQIGTGERNDKRRTYREQDGFVVDHVTGRRITIKDLYKGNIGGLHK